MILLCYSYKCMIFRILCVVTQLTITFNIDPTVDQQILNTIIL